MTINCRQCAYNLLQTTMAILSKLVSIIRGLFASKVSAPQKQSSITLDDKDDPLDKSSLWSTHKKLQSLEELSQRRFLTVDDFPKVESYQHVEKTNDGMRIIMDELPPVVALDSCGAPCPGPEISGTDFGSPFVANPFVQQWYVSQSFIGYQSCAVIAQHWLVSKAMTMAGQDAVRNGWEISVKDEVTLTDNLRNKLLELDKKFHIKKHLIKYMWGINTFGIRVVLPLVDSDDPDFYAKPFNPDGVRPGSYKGMKQIDPYWMMPILTAEDSSDPTKPHFYDPTYWNISGRRYHRSHLIIGRGPEVADFLKPTYIFGGLPLTQRIYERIYAAERTANEAPTLAMDKRMTVLKLDTRKALMNESEVLGRIEQWIKFKDNHAVKLLDKSEEAAQFDTNLSDFDSIIMNQYQLVAAIAEVPATKLLGTSPKGFNATGEFESKSYTEHLESIQENVFTEFVDRHNLLSIRSLGEDFEVEVAWNPTDSPTMQELADLNEKKANTDKVRIDSGVVSPDEARNKLRDDKRSGYNRLKDEDANANIGMSPENLVEFEKIGAEKEKAQAAQTSAGARQEAAGAQVEKAQKMPEKDSLQGVEGQRGEMVGQAFEQRKPDANLQLHNPDNSQQFVNAQTLAALQTLSEALKGIAHYVMPEGKVVGGESRHPGSVNPSVNGDMYRSVAGIRDVVENMPPEKMPKMKLHGRVIQIENPRGTIRRGQSADGKHWSVKMPDHYGYIRGVQGADGDDLDCFVGPDVSNKQVHVINQKDPTTEEFDEHKVMFGFPSRDDAIKAYKDAYSDDWKGFDDCVSMDLDVFNEWACSQPLNAKCMATNKTDVPRSFSSGGIELS